MKPFYSATLLLAVLPLVSCDDYLDVVPKGKKRDELVAQARALRAMTYFNLANYYCDTYQTATAAQKGGVPVITSANLGASYTQPSLQEVYDFILADMAAAYPKLPREAATILHPSIAAADAFYYATLTGYHNIGGITTTEVYLIKAECLARSGRVAEAMTALNTVRESRILADQYQPLSAASEAEAMQLIMRTKQNEMILTPFNFNDARRLNLEGKYPQLPTKVIDGKTTQLSATSHLWTFSFPQGAVDNPGNGTIKQNVTK